MNSDGFSIITWSKELTTTIVPVPMTAVRELDFSATKQPESRVEWNARTLVKQEPESKAPAEKHAAGLPPGHVAANRKRQKPLDMSGKPGAGLQSGHVAANRRAQEVRNLSPEILAAGLPTPENTEIKTQQKRHFAHPSSGVPLMRPMTPNTAAVVKENALPASPSEILATKSRTPSAEDAVEKKELPKRSGIPTLIKHTELGR
jgi:hypothetical protein